MDLPAPHDECESTRASDWESGSSSPAEEDSHDLPIRVTTPSAPFYRLGIPAQRTMEIQIGLESYRFAADTAINLAVTAPPIAPVCIFTDVEPGDPRTSTYASRPRASLPWWSTS